jgi:hypothetical protein
VRGAFDTFAYSVASHGLSLIKRHQNGALFCVTVHGEGAPVGMLMEAGAAVNKGSAFAYFWILSTTSCMAWIIISG